jgi:hypothetical protein
MKKILLVVLTCLSFHSVYSLSYTANTQGTIMEDDITYYTMGPIMTDGFTCTRPGDFLVQSYVFPIKGYALYDNARNNFKLETNLYIAALSVNFGIMNWLDFSITPAWTWPKVEHHHGSQFADLPVGFGIQLVRDDKESYAPGIRLKLNQVFPTGKYNNIDPEKILADTSGSGVYATSIGFNMGKTLYWFKAHPLVWRTVVTYTFPAKAHLKNYSVYGGGIGTHGTLKVGQGLLTNFAFELCLTPHWVLSLDFQIQQGWHSSHFKGNPGYIPVTVDVPIIGPTVIQVPAENKSSQNDLYICCPSLEYNFGGAWSVQAGILFTYSGKNNPNFIGGAFTGVYSY